MLGDARNFAIAMVAFALPSCESDVCADLVSFHQDAFGLSDGVATVNGSVALPHRFAFLFQLRAGGRQLLVESGDPGNCSSSACDASAASRTTNEFDGLSVLGCTEVRDGSDRVVAASRFLA